MTNEDKIKQLADAELSNGWALGVIMTIMLNDSLPEDAKKIFAAFTLDETLLHKCAEKVVVAMRNLRRDASKEDVAKIVYILVEEYEGWIALRKAAGL